MPIHLQGIEPYHWTPPLQELGSQRGCILVDEKARSHIAESDRPITIHLNVAYGLDLCGIEEPGKAFRIACTLSHGGTTSALATFDYTWPERQSGMLAAMFLAADVLFREPTVYTFNFLIDGEPLVRVSIPAFFGVDVER